MKAPSASSKISFTPLRLLCPSRRRAVFDLDMGNLGCPHDVADADLVGPPRQPHPTIAAAHGRNQSRARQHVDDLEDVLLRDLQALGQLGDLDQPIVGAGTIEQDSGSHGGGFGQAHRREGSLVRVWPKANASWPELRSLSGGPPPVGAGPVGRPAVPRLFLEARAGRRGSHAGPGAPRYLVRISLPLAVMRRR
jgi:hypothetical protein